MIETHWSVNLAVPQQLHWSDTDTTETHWSVDLVVHTAVTLVRYGHYRDTLVSRLSCSTAVIILVRYGHYRDTLVSRLSCTYSSYTGQIRTLQRHAHWSVDFFLFIYFFVYVMLISGVNMNSSS